VDATKNKVVNIQVSYTSLSYKKTEVNKYAYSNLQLGLLMLNYTVIVSVLKALICVYNESRMIILNGSNKSSFSCEQQQQKQQQIV